MHVLSKSLFSIDYMLVFHQDCKGKKKVCVEGYQDQKIILYKSLMISPFSKGPSHGSCSTCRLSSTGDRSSQGSTLGQAVARPSRTCSTSKHPKRPDTDRNHPTIWQAAYASGRKTGGMLPSTQGSEREVNCSRERRVGSSNIFGACQIALRKATAVWVDWVH